MKQKGFTLIELMITIAIMVILAGVGAVLYTNMLEKANEGKTQAALGDIRSAVSLYYADNLGSYPTAIGDATGKVDASMQAYIGEATTTGGPKEWMPQALVPIKSRAVVNEGGGSWTDPTGSGGWYYSPNDSTGKAAGLVAVNCNALSSDGSTAYFAW